MVSFDLEGRWGMPFPATYDLPAATAEILACLAAHGVVGVFFVVGELALEHPDAVAAIAAGGHEIGLHGFRHERFDLLDDEALAEVDDGMARSEALIEEITSRRPIGFRAPYLLYPRFTDARVDSMLQSRGYRWMSNVEVRQPVELARPSLLRTSRVGEFFSAHPRLIDGPTECAISVALNLRLCALLQGTNTYRDTLRWMATGFEPFLRSGMLEIPVTGPLDCDVIGLPDPSQSSSSTELDYASFAMGRSLFGRGGYAMLSFHDWVIAGGNRIALLDRLLSAVRSSRLRTVTGQALLR